MSRILAAAITVTLSGCASLTNRIDVPVSELTEMPIANTHYYQILDELGPPAQITTLPEGFAFLYESIYLRDRQIGFSPGTGSYGALFKISYGRVTMQREILVVQFDDSGVARAAAVYSGKEPIGGSFTVQPIFGVAPSVDTSYLKVPPVQQTWGWGALRRLPETLNAQYDLRSGTAGIQLTGTPTSIGQHALETQNSKKQKRRNR